MKYKALYALLAFSLLLGYTVPGDTAFAEGDSPVQEEPTNPTSPEQGDSDNDNPGGEETPEPPVEEDLPSNDPSTEIEGSGSGNNNETPVAPNPTPDDPVQGMTPDDTETPGVTYVPGETVEETPSSVEATPEVKRQVHVSGQSYAVTEGDTEVATAVDEQIENDQKATSDDSSVEIPNTGEGGVNMLAVGLLAIAGVTILAAAAIVILMNKLAKRAESNLQ